MQSLALSAAALSVLAGFAVPAAASEQDALDIDRNIRAIHMPFGTVVDPMFAAADSSEITGYTRCGDSAIWTGHYLAAEAFRYAVTRSPEALDNAKAALDGIRTLLDVTGSGVLARCAVPSDSPYAPGIASEEAHNGVYSANLNGTTYSWIGNTSRDQYSGVMFGLSIAYDAIDDADVRSAIRDLVTRILDYLDGNDWNIVMPDGSASSTFLGRFDQEASFLAVGRQVDSNRFGSGYNRYRALHAALLTGPIGVDCLDSHSAYFKFNLDTINLYDLVRLETSSFYGWWYGNAYDLLRKTTDNHGNAFFNMIDRSLKGPNAQRDAETRDLLEAWLRRPRRDTWVDLRGAVAACGDNQACDPLPVDQRVATDFLWQRSPFLLSGGGEGRIESAGIDYILPYWMARYYRVIQQ